jgi:hypothetical protein
LHKAGWGAEAARRNDEKQICDRNARTIRQFRPFGLSVRSAKIKFLKVCRVSTVPSFARALVANFNDTSPLSRQIIGAWRSSDEALCKCVTYEKGFVAPQLPARLRWHV